MRAAIYARKSTEQHGISEESKSVTRQLEHARAFAERQGWSVVEEFADDGISGAEFERRPGFVQMLNALRARGFDVLIVSELSRLGREQLELGYVMKQLGQAEVAVWSYLEEKRIGIDSAVDKFMMSAVNFAAEIEREKAAARVRDAMLRKARAGHVTGGRVFGYDNVRINSHVERRINASEAAVIKRIYELSAEGNGLTRITKLLNEEGAPAPRPQQGRPAGWASSSVREVLTRSLYRGQIIYGRTKKRDKFGAARSSERPSSEWLTVSAPELAIISEDLASAADQKFAARKQKHHGGSGRRSDVESNYLLSGFLRCAECGGGLSVQSRQHGGRRRFFYSCSSNWNKGKRACSNNLAADMELVDQEVLATLNDDILRPAVVKEAVKLAVSELSPEAQARDRAKREAELLQVRQECERLAEAIGAGGPLQALVARLTERQAHAEALEQAVAAKARQAPALDRPGLERQLRAKLADWKKLLGRNIAEGRQALRALLVGPIRMQPVREERRRGYQFSATIALDRLLSGVVELPTVVASPGGTAARWTLELEGFSELRRAA
jgi:site-specific DNA recombinase